MSGNETSSTVAKGCIIDNMNTVSEYTTTQVAQELGVPKEEAREYLEELAEDNRIRKREKRNSETVWIRFR